MATGHAEIAGAGFAGLVAAIALADRGWSVRVHERTPFLRAEGFALTIHGNGVKVLKALGVFEAAIEGAMRISRLETRNVRNETTLALTPASALYRISRQHLIATLAAAAEQRGVEVLVDSPVVSAKPDGQLVLENGQVCKADLVIGAEGVNSHVRDAIGVRVSRIVLQAGGACRMVIPRSAAEKALEPGDAAVNYEYWSGTRRIIANPCSRDDLYLALSCQDADVSGKRIPLDVPSWQEAFPHLSAVIERVGRDTDWERVLWARFLIIRLSRWSAGRVAIVGDAAHAMPPDLGQGGGTAMMNALALAVALAESADVEAGLSLWEQRERPLTEHTQRLARIYNYSTLWPERLRTGVFKFVGRTAFLREQVQRTANHIPRGYTDEGGCHVSRPHG